VIPASYADEDFCYLSTTGRVTGRIHTIEIWFAADGERLYLLAGAGERSDWIRNLRADPHVGVRIADRLWDGSADVVTDAAEREAAAALVFDKYQPRYGGDLTSWQASSLLVAVSLDSEVRGERVQG
jgi:deazaflavin-dependent oxidoreductase (nitroreductase family)